MAAVMAALVFLLFPCAARAGQTPSIDTSAAGITRPSAFSMVSRVYIPYNAAGDGFGFGMGAAEQVAYDHAQKYAYAVSEQGAINVIDLNDPSNPVVRVAFALDLAGTKLTDIEICSSKGLMFVGAGAADTVSNGNVHIFTTVQRANPAKPVQLLVQSVGPLPDMVLPNSDCSKVAVANEGEGEIISSALVDPAGSISILDVSVSGTAVPPAAGDVSVTKTDVALTQWTDDQLISQGVHLPLPLKAMEYFDLHGKNKDTLDFTTARSTYNAAMNLEPEYLGWSHDDRTLYVNLQENNAVVTISVPASGAPSVREVSSLGLKDHSSVGLDIVKDAACTQATYAGFKALRMPDSIQAVRVDGTTYVLTANEGDDKGYGDFDEKQKLKDLFSSAGAVVTSDWPNFTATTAASTTAQAVFSAQDSMRVTVGSSAVNYSQADAPVVQEIVAFGGRGLSIYRDTGSSLALHWDSGANFEKELCAAYPWSHNGIQDEEFAPKHGVLYNASGSKLQGTIDEMNDPSQDGCADGGDGQAGACPLGQTVDERSAKDGSATEAVVAGIACGSLLAVTATEKSGVAFVYDISNIAAPTLLFIKHLSPASQSKNPGVAYAARELGEVDPEAMIFLDAAHSPSGKAGVLFAGAWSGTMSFWEFTCPPAATNEVSAAHPLGLGSAVNLALAAIFAFAAWAVAL